MSLKVEVLIKGYTVFLPMRNCTILQQGNASVHTAKSVQNWLRQEGHEILDSWPGNSRDLNLICPKTKNGQIEPVFSQRFN